MINKQLVYIGNVPFCKLSITKQSAIVQNGTNQTEGKSILLDYTKSNLTAIPPLKVYWINNPYFACFSQHFLSGNISALFSLSF
jgi:hypothetical protein